MEEASVSSRSILEDFICTNECVVALGTVGTIGSSFFSCAGSNSLEFNDSDFFDRDVKIWYAL